MTNFDGVAIKAFIGFRDRLLRECADLQTTEQIEPHKRGIDADDCDLILRRWFWLYRDMAKTLNNHGVPGIWVDSKFDLPRGKRVKNCQDWLTEREEENVQALETLQQRKREKNTRRDKKAINILLNGWTYRAKTIARCREAIEKRYQGPNRSAQEIADELEKRHGPRKNRPH